MHPSNEERAQLIRALHEASNGPTPTPGTSTPEGSPDTGADTEPPTTPDTATDTAQFERAGVGGPIIDGVDRERLDDLARSLEQGDELDLSDPAVREAVRFAVSQPDAATGEWAFLADAVRDQGNQVETQEFLERVARVADEAVEVHAESDRPVEEVFTELAAKDGIITSQGDVASASHAEHIARLKAVSRELDYAIHQLHEHDPEAIVRTNSPDEVALAQRTQEIPVQDQPELDAPERGEPYTTPAMPALMMEHPDVPQR